jgi:hypothetical protein
MSREPAKAGFVAERPIGAVSNRQQEVSMSSDIAIPASAETEMPIPQASHRRRQALLVVSVAVALLVVLWLGDTLSGLVPKQPFHPPTQHAGPNLVSYALVPAAPVAGQPFTVTATLTDAAHHPLPNATITYQWDMVAMDMGTISGKATSGKTAGQYAVNVVAAMGGYWRLTLTIQVPNQPRATTALDIPVHG